MKGVKCNPDPDALRRKGWRPPLIPGWYQDLCFVIGQRPQYRGKSFRVILQDALAAFATGKELLEVAPLEKEES